jgi:transposase InsO family protein
LKERLFTLKERLFTLKEAITQLCTSFTELYNEWRPHEYLGSTTPALAYQNKAVPLVSKNAKDVPIDLEIKRLDDTKVTV